MRNQTETGLAKPLRVVELGSWLAAPGAAALLADIGADVIKVEPPTGDPGRNFIAALGGNGTTTPSFAMLNRYKKSIVIDLSAQEGRATFDDLLATADVFVTNMRDGSLDRIGLGTEAVTKRFPRLVYASISGLGLRGPDRNKPAYDVGAFWARSGLISQIIVPGASPPSPTGGYGDLVTALAMYAAIMTALYERERTGRGGLVETSLLQAGAYMVGGDLAVQAAHGRTPQQQPRRQSRTPMVNSYQTADGCWFFLTGVEARRHFPNLCAAIDHPELVNDARFASSRAIRENGAALIAILDAAFATGTLAEWARRLDEAGVWWQSVSTLAEVLEDPQVAANAMLSPVLNGERVMPIVTSPFKIFRRTLAVARAPDLNEHHGAVLSGLEHNDG